nr:immunoglobulin heavy chain junction region [Macaca mulatta]
CATERRNDAYNYFDSW